MGKSISKVVYRLPQEGRTGTLNNSEVRMSALIWRVLIAVICVVIIYAILPPFFRIVGFDLSSDVLLIVRVCVAGLAVLYVLKGPPFPLA